MSSQGRHMISFCKRDNSLKWNVQIFTRTEESLLAELPALAEHITEIDHVWVTREQATITTALPEAQIAAQRLKQVQNAHHEAHTRVVTLREQRDLDAEPLGDRQSSIKIAILVREVTAKG